MSSRNCSTPPLVLDGGFATQLERRGLKAENDPLFGGTFLSTHPDDIAAVHASFLESGSDVITTATYQATTEAMCEHLNIDHSEAVALIYKAVALAKEECEKFWTKNLKDENRHQFLLPRLRPRVAGSVGPYGATLCDGSEYHGKYVDSISKEELKAFHRPRVQNLIAADVDFIAFETIPARKEGEAIVELLREFPSTEAWLSFSAKDGKSTCYGDLIEDAFKNCLSQDSGKQLVAIGINCTSPGFITPLLERAKQGLHTDVPFIVYPNSGEQWTLEKKWAKGDNNPIICSYVEEWMDIGAQFIGGCCRVSPSEIRDVAKKIGELCA